MDDRPLLVSGVSFPAGMPGESALGRPEPAQHVFQSPAGWRPVRGDDRKTRGIARDDIGREPMRAQDAFELGADPRQSGARSVVARIGVEADGTGPPRL